MSMHRWIAVPDDEEEGYKILTEEKVLKSDDGDQQHWIATVYEKEDADRLVKFHNSLVALELSSEELEINASITSISDLCKVAEALQQKLRTEPTVKTAQALEDTAATIKMLLGGVDDG